jgi:hypothetical protein
MITGEIIKTSTNKTIEVFDNAISFDTQTKIFEIINGFRYTINGAEYAGQNLRQIIGTKCSKQDVENFGFLAEPKISEILEKYEFKEVTQARVNVSNCAEYNSPHTDGSRFTLLYYASLEWNISWAGQTLFLDDSLEKVEYCSLYKPGKIIVFDSTIPHLIVTPTIHAKSYRFSFVLQFI